MRRPTDGGPWFRRHPGTAGVRARLVCFPHAGGTAQLFRGWSARLPGDVEVLAACYPGRQERIADRFPADMDELAGALVAHLEPYLDRPFALFGHSMGSSLAYEAAVRIKDRYGLSPLRLMVSGRAAPHRARPTGLHERDDETLLAAVRELGDLGSEAYDIPELRELLLPALRADYRLVETYRPRPGATVDAPITAYVGEADPGCVLDDVLAWAELTTTGDFSLRSYPGDHFYLARQEAALVADLTKDLEA